MWFGRRLVRLTETDARPVINEFRETYLQIAAQQMRGGAGRLPLRYFRRFLSNTEGLPPSHSPSQRISEKLWIAVGGFWLKVSYEGTVDETHQDWYNIRLVSTFRVEKPYNYQPNTEMGLPENPPATLDLAPDWFAPPPFDPFPPGNNRWRVYFPDEWGDALRTEGRAEPFVLKGLWMRAEGFLAVDRDCNGWDPEDIIGGPATIWDYLPSSENPTPQNAATRRFYAPPGSK